MNDDFDCVLVTPGDARSGDMPRVLKPENIDAWPSAEATERAIRIIIELINRGYAGVRLEYGELSGGKKLINFRTKGDTPAGWFAEMILASAKAGSVPSVTEAFTFLERFYRELGFPIPHKTKSQRANAGSNKKDT